MIKLALPTGDLRYPTADLIQSRGLRVEGYAEGSRQYRSLPVSSHEDVRVRVFRERDIPMQVALGNYDMGIASLSWIMEMQVRFPQQPLVPIAALGLGGDDVWAAIHPQTGATLEDLGRLASVRIASDTPNIADSFARAARLRRYRVQAVHGAAEAYPPEDADLVIVAAQESAFEQNGLTPLLKVLDSTAWLVANAESLASRRLHPIIGPLTEGLGASPSPRLCMPGPVAAAASNGVAQFRETVRLALPDGHQKPHVVEALNAAGLHFKGYSETVTERRPETGIAGLDVKVIRPQDMPQLVALGEFDLAVTGRDLMREHLFEFPSSPVIELVDLQRAQYNLSAVVDGDLPVDNMDDAVALWRSQGKELLTVAAEFPATADHYARSRHFWRYQVVPIAGASEGFVPEDADILIEGTETGKTIAENNLKVIDTLYRSTTCLIGRSDTRLQGNRRKVYEHVLTLLSKAGQVPAV